MKLMMLGASLAQYSGIEKAKALGLNVVTCDYIPHAVGHRIADEKTFVSTFDLEGVLKEAKRFGIDGIMTMGTDQPVYTAAYVAKHMDLPSMISMKTALGVTNKIQMKETFTKYDIPTVDYLFYEKGVNDFSLETLDFPVVVKPVDSQGQRGIYYLETAQKVREHYDKVVMHSRLKKILVEKYYEHEEITISGWVSDGLLTVLAITDRVTFEEKDKLGICLAHEFPSKYLAENGDEIIDLSEKIVAAFEICNGPIYFQFLMGDEGIKVNEIACRIGGAFEASFIPILTGFDLCDAQIKRTLGLAADYKPLSGYDVRTNKEYLSVQLFFSTPCLIDYMPSADEIKKIAGVMDVGFNFNKGDCLMSIHDATARVGYVIVKAETKEKLEQRLCEIYEVLRIEDKQGVNHIIHRPIKN